jgi:hypothetical protein
VRRKQHCLSWPAQPVDSLPDHLGVVKLQKPGTCKHTATTKEQIMAEESHYRINIAKRSAKRGWDGKPAYKHYFRVDIIHNDDAVTVLADLRKKFKSPGHVIEMTYWSCVGYPVNDKGAQHEKR